VTADSDTYRSRRMIQIQPTRSTLNDEIFH